MFADMNTYPDTEITEVRQWLKSQNIKSLGEIAKRAGLSPYTLHKIRYGKRKQCRYSTIKALLTEMHKENHPLA